MKKMMTCLVAMSLLAAPAAEAELVPTDVDGIRYVSGGVGEGEREEMQRMKKDYNLYILSAGPAGEFIGNTQVLITDKNGSPVVEAVAEPQLYVFLPPGTYSVQGTYHNQQREQKVSIGRGKTRSIVFTWRRDDPESIAPEMIPAPTRLEEQVPPECDIVKDRVVYGDDGEPMGFSQAAACKRLKR